jgi:peptidyl-prolyl cis-trans isomerase SurA
MSSMKKLKYALIAAAPLVMCIGLRAEVIEQVLMKVNGEIFTKTDLETRQVAALRQMGQQADSKTNLSDEQLRKMLSEVTPRLLVDVVDEILLVQRGHDLGYKMNDENFQTILDNLKKDNKINTDEDFQAALKQENMTMAELRKNMERQWIASRVQQNEVLGRVSVSEEEARRYYDEHKNEFTSAAAVTLREILVSVPKDANAATDNAARQKATELRQRALKGDSFEKLAADFSDAPSKTNGGLIGPLNLADLTPDVRGVLDKMTPGAVSDVLRATNGYDVIKLETRTEPQTLPFEQAREEIGNRVFTDKRKTEFDKYLTKLRTDAIIEFKNDDIKKAYEQGLAQAKSGAATQ